MTNGPLHQISADGDDAADDELTVSLLDSEDAPARSPLAPLSTLRLRGMWRMSGVVTVIALLAVVLVAIAPHLPRALPMRYHPQFTALEVSKDVAQCMQVTSWSHDGRHIAATLSSGCEQPYVGQKPPQPNLILFDAASGRQVAAFMLDDYVTTALRQSSGIPQNAASFDIGYYDAQWSVDNTQIVVLWSIYGDKVAYQGVLVITVTGSARGHVSALINKAVNDASTPSPSGNALMPIDRWDLQSQTHTTMYLPPALAYQWLPGDTLVAVDPLSLTGANVSAGPTALGNAIGGQSFSMWRDGSALPADNTACAPHPSASPYSTLYLYTVVWSPDGRYLLDVMVAARVALPQGKPTPTTPPTDGSCANVAPSDVAPIVPMRDAGLRAATVALTSRPGATNELALAWSADGRRLAVGAQSFTATNSKVMIYDCASGALLQTFTSDEFATGDLNGATSALLNPRWSPDGNHLLLTLNGAQSGLVIVNSQSLA